MNKQMYTPIRIVCGTLFCLFSLIYFSVYQADIMAVAQRAASEGKTHYQPYVSALVITLVLQLLQKGVYRLTNLYKRFYFLTYVPSLMAMVFLSSLVEADTTYWWWMMPLLLALWGVAVWLCRMGQAIEGKDGAGVLSSNVMLTNVASLVFLLFLTAWIGDKPEGQYQQAHTETVIADNVRTFTAQRDTITNPNQWLADNTLIGLLMEKRVKEFVRLVPRYYDVSQPIPRIYAEALVLNMSMTSRPQVYWRGKYNGKSVNDDFREFTKWRKQLADAKTKKAPSEYNALHEAFRKRYRDTYWYYFFNA